MTRGAPTTPATPERRRSTFGPTVLVGLAAAGLATVGAGRDWATATTTAQGRRTVAAAGTDVVAGALPLALVALACWGAVLVLRSRGRRAVAVLGILASGSAAAAVVTGAGDAGDVATRMVGGASDVTVASSAWPAVTAVACVVAAVTFLLALVKAPQWPEMSARYDSPADRASDDRPLTDAELWRALDEGRDPTS